MDFKRYLRQQDPQRHPRVYIERSDCYGYWKGDLPGAKAIIALVIHGEHHLYLLPENSERLWTMDEDGNPKARSVFQFKE